MVMVLVMLYLTYILLIMFAIWLLAILVLRSQALKISVMSFRYRDSNCFADGVSSAIALPDLLSVERECNQLVAKAIFPRDGTSARLIHITPSELDVKEEGQYLASTATKLDALHDEDKNLLAIAALELRPHIKFIVDHKIEQKALYSGPVYDGIIREMPEKVMDYDMEVVLQPLGSSEAGILEFTKSYIFLLQLLMQQQEEKIIS